ncbi:MAG: heme biosynthesis protein HemY [Burkholderiales bacterium]|jgi:HemY protein|uniref:Heme biosynthesis protein HemY n=1 Tax=Candidatus Desulfobacillus denitrificans TaxID=2608985 RepID=A0A809S6Q8_9PROT|nr:heme biosynthesis protein HemY [Rhodocyclaceae bacterium]MCZ2173551.1 heme biosynthesis protein HemY [Burkholderiales bacterium]OQY66613.1 MAG: heme biosynthesis protein HemY [Rhodocyclaceae bacterium UTPRO2]BBO21821.1 heme biosynthesis protein HemY [Candidatus Desulfobacillus denitrificans]GIK45192.1 MAG: porphyrin biosynthesis-like protein [Betaproteobacteria bacterium]
MRILLWLLALFALAVGVSMAFGYNEGYVLIVLSPWRVELSLNLFLVLGVGGFLFGHLLLRLVSHTLRLPQAVRAFRERKRKDKAARALREAVQQLFEGRYGHALKNAALSHAAGEAPALSALVAARAAHFLRDTEREVEWLKRAAEHDAEAHAARLMTEAELHLDARRFDAARAALDALQAGGGRHIAALRMALRVHRGLGRWDDVLKVARQLEKHRALTHEAAAPLKQRAHLENLRGREGDARALVAYWEAVPAEERRASRLATAAARALIAAGDGAAAQRIIEQHIEGEWNSELAGLYAECRGGDTLGRIARAEKWLEKHPQDARLLLALGRLCREQQLWGKAQSYFEASLAIQPSQDAHVELATLFAQLGRSEESNQAYRSAAALCRQA